VRLDLDFTFKKNLARVIGLGCKHSGLDLDREIWQFAVSGLWALYPHNDWQNTFAGQFR